MEKVKTQGFTAKDEFNSAVSESLADAKNSIIHVVDVMVKEDKEGKVAAFFKDGEGKIYATISDTVIDQSLALMDLVPADILVSPRKSKNNREYLVLELQ